MTLRPTAGPLPLRRHRLLPESKGSHARLAGPRGRRRRARPKPNTKPDTLFKGPGVTILDRQGVQAIRSDKSGATGWVVAFYAPWCGHCRHYAPEFKKFGAALQGQYPNIKAGAVSCTAERRACDENRVKGYPTVKSFGALGHDIVLKRHQAKDLLELVRKKATDVAFAGLVKPKWSAEPPKVISAPTPQSPYDKIMATAQPPPKLRAAPSTIDAAASFRFMLENAFVGSQTHGGEKRRAAGFASRRGASVARDHRGGRRCPMSATAAEPDFHRLGVLVGGRRRRQVPRRDDARPAQALDQ